MNPQGVMSLQGNAILSALLSRTPFYVSVTQGVTHLRVSACIFNIFAWMQVFAHKVVDGLHYLTGR